MCRTECTMFSEVYMGNPGKVPYCNERDQFEPDCTNCKRPNVTKADKIISMTDEELAVWIFTHRWNDCSSLLNWLKQEAEEDET